MQNIDVRFLCKAISNRCLLFVLPCIMCSRTKFNYILWNWPLYIYPKTMVNNQYFNLRIRYKTRFGAQIRQMKEKAVFMDRFPDVISLSLFTISQNIFDHKIFFWMTIKCDNDDKKKGHFCFLCASAGLFFSNAQCKYMKAIIGQ